MITQNIDEIIMQVKDVIFVLNMSKGFELGNLLNSAIILPQNNLNDKQTLLNKLPAFL